jgi:acyl dehydratase
MRASHAVILDPDLGLDYSRVVHGEQSFTYRRPIVAGDELVVTTSIENIRTMAGNDMITTRGDIATVDGEHVATTVSLIISRAPEDAS